MPGEEDQLPCWQLLQSSGSPGRRGVAPGLPYMRDW